MSQYRDYRLFTAKKRLSDAGFHPLDVMVTGVTGAGKSTTLNSLFEQVVATVGDGVDPETMDIDFYTLSDGGIRLWDTAGLGDGPVADGIHSKRIVDLLYRAYGDSRQYGLIDLVLVILDGGSRDLGTTYKLINEVVVPNIQADRILVAINQADMTMKGEEWDYHTNQPNPPLVRMLQDKVDSIKRRVREATGVSVSPIYYSAKYNYNIRTLLDLIIDNIPRERRRFVR